MSNPLSHFTNLNLNDMAETRSQRQRGQRGAGRPAARRGRGRGRAAGQPPATPIPPVQGHSGALYNTQDLSPDSQIRAAEGLAADFYVDLVRNHEKPDHTDAYHAFQLMKPVSVHVHDPSFGVNKVKCSCGGGDDSACCEHIYWLYDALNAVLGEPSTSNIRSIAPGTVITEISGLYDQVAERMNSLPDLLNSIGENESDDDDEVAVRKTTVRDMLSVFDRVALPEEYLQELTDVSTDTPIDQVFVPGNLGATIYKLALRDESIYETLRRVIHRDLCARYYLTKQRRRARQALLDFDRFALRGPSSNMLAQEMDVGECGRTLRRIVWEICQDRESRLSKGPFKDETKRLAPEILVEILEGVCERNKGINSVNLYVHLIGEPPRAARPEEQGAFVIDHLRDFPPEEWSHLADWLSDIAGQVKQNAPSEGHASMGYALKIEDMVKDFVGNAFEPSSLAVQHPRRPTLSDEREAQRPRFG